MPAASPPQDACGRSSIGLPMSYTFSLIRFVPDPARGEFVNIGAMAGDDDAGDWAVRWIGNYTRAKALDEHGFLPAAKAFTASLDDRVGDPDSPTLDLERPLAGWLKSLADEMNNVIQVTEPAPVVADSAESALDLIFERLIVDPARVTYRFKRKHQAQAAARSAYRAHEVPDSSVKQRARVASRAYDFQFDFAVHNGRAVQLLQCWSFQLPNQADLTEEVKAWAWMVHEVQDNGGHLVSEGGIEVPQELDIAAVYIPPLDRMSPAFGEAKSAFDELGVTAASFDQADAVGVAAAQRLAPPGGG